MKEMKVDTHSEVAGVFIGTTRFVTLDCDLAVAAPGADSVTCSPRTGSDGPSLTEQFV